MPTPMLDDNRINATMAAAPKIALAERIASDGLRGWRWFLDGDWIVFEPPGGNEIHMTELQLVAAFGGAVCVGAVFRATPHPGIYLRFKRKEDVP